MKTPECLCRFEGCERKSWAKGLCATHYAQSRRNKGLFKIGSFIKDLSGTNNPNYKDGRTVARHFCGCGRERDYRAKSCAICSKRGFSKTGERLFSDDDFKKAISNSHNFSELCIKLGISRNLARSEIKQLGVDTSHFTCPKNRVLSDKEVFTKKEFRTENAATLRRRFLKINTCEYKCKECCSDPSWNGKALTLQLDHINGDRLDDRLENLRWLCPNCHSQQITSCRTKDSLKILLTSETK
jgi:Zn finger protein HypA/HybF involved in hydrogenase expression